MEPRIETTTDVKTPAPAAAELPKPESARVSLFGRYRSLTSRPKAEDAAPPQAKIEKPAPALAISVGPTDRPMSSHDEDELEIPAFLRRQAN